SQLTNFAVYQASGGPLPQKQVDDFGAQFAEVVAEVKLIGAQRFILGLPDIPASQAFTQVYAKHSFNAATVRVMDFFSDIFFQETQAAPLSNLSLYELGEDAVSLQGLLSASIVPDGYIQFANLLAAGL